MTAAPTRRRRRAAAASSLPWMALALVFGAAACDPTIPDGVEFVLIAIGLGGPILTVVLASRRGEMTLGVVLLALFIWPVGLIYVLGRGKKEGGGQNRDRSGAD